MIPPQKENKNVGFAYTVTMEQIRKHAALSPEEVLHCIEETAALTYEVQTEEERKRKYIFKSNKDLSSFIP